MKLHEALRRAVWQFGINILQDHCLMPVLADYRAFDDYPAMKQVMKAVVDAGHGKEFCRIALGERPSECLSYAGTMKKSLIRNCHFTEEFSGYAADSVLFALGFRQSADEPSDHGYEAVQKISGTAQAGLSGRSSASPKARTETEAAPKTDRKKSASAPSGLKETDALFRLGQEYYYGTGVRKDYRKAAECYRKAAEQGHSDAAEKLGYMYRDGLGVERSWSEAQRWFSKVRRAPSPVPQSRAAAPQGKGQNAAASENYDPDKMFRLGENRFHGWGVVQDFARAAEYYRKAADKRHPKPAYTIGYMYQYGLGVKKDTDRAAEYYRRAVAYGYSDAKVLLDDMRRHEEI